MDDHTEESGDDETSDKAFNEDEDELETPVEKDAEATDEVVKSSSDDESEQSVDSDPADEDEEVDGRSEDDDSNDGSSAETNAGLSELQEELAATRKQVDNLETKLEDYKRRNEREHEEIRKYAVEDLASEMLTVRDMLDDAIEFEDLEADTESRLEMVIAQFDQILTSGSIERIKPNQGESYDNNLHRMTDKVKAKNHDENDIVRVLEIGYKTNDRVIRPASVQVAAGGSN